MINEIKQDAQGAHERKRWMRSPRFVPVAPSILDSVMVSYYGADAPLRQVANVVAEDSRTLALTVFDKSMIQAWRRPS